MSSKDSAISPTKIVIFVIIVIGFIVLAYFITKAVGKSCTSGQEFDNTLNKCIDSCVGSYKDGAGGCMDCPKGQSKPTGSNICINPCQNDQKNCAANCFDPISQECLPDNTICDSFKVDRYANKCCSNSESYELVPSPYLPDGFSATVKCDDVGCDGDNVDNCTISNMICQIKKAIYDDLTVDITQKEFDDFHDKLKALNIVTIGGLMAIKPIDYINMGLSETFDKVLRPILGFKTCGSCPVGNQVCDGVCCPVGQVCAGSGTNVVCCDPAHVRTNKDTGATSCCVVYATVDGCCADDQAVSSDGQYCMTLCGTGAKQIACKGNSEKCETASRYDASGAKVEDVIVCAPIGCEHDTYVYTPASILGKDNVTYATCQLTKQSGGPYATCKSVPNLSSYTRSASANFPSPCNENNCWDTLSDTGVMGVDYNESTQHCSSNISCLATDLQDATKCVCPYGDGDTRCCKTLDGKYNGLACPSGSSVCMADPTTATQFKCVSGYNCAVTANGLECVPSDNGPYKTLDACNAAIDSGACDCTQPDGNDKTFTKIKIDGKYQCYRTPPATTSFPCTTVAKPHTCNTNWSAFNDNNADYNAYPCWGGNELEKCNAGAGDTLQKIPFGHYYCTAGAVDKRDGTIPGPYNWKQCPDTGGCDNPYYNTGGQSGGIWQMIHNPFSANTTTINSCSLPASS